MSMQTGPHQPPASASASASPSVEACVDAVFAWTGAPDAMPDELVSMRAPGSLLRVLARAADGDLLRAADRRDLARLCVHPALAPCAVALLSPRLRALAAASRVRPPHANVAAPAARLFALAVRVSRPALLPPHVWSLGFADGILAFALALSSLADALATPILAVAPLRNLLLHPYINDPSSNHHTYDSLPEFPSSVPKSTAQAKMHAYALPVVTAPITQIVRNIHSPQLEARDFALYCYYAGILFAALKEFPRAVEQFRACLAVPSRALSAIQVEAWRKGLLCNVLANSSVSGTETPNFRLKAAGKYSDDGASFSNEDSSSSASNPASWKEFQKGGVARSVSSVVWRDLDNGGYRKAYIQFVDAFEKGIRADIQNELLKNMGEFQKSGNFGLAKQCLDLRTLAARQIIRLTHTHIAISISEISETLSSTLLAPRSEQPTDQGSAAANTVSDTKSSNTGESVDAEFVRSVIVGLISTQSVYATIDEGPGGAVVRFHNDDSSGNSQSQAYSDEASMRELDTAVKLAMRVHARVGDMQRQIAVSKEYLSRTVFLDNASKDNRTKAAFGEVGSGAIEASADDVLMGESDF
ncbi:COP9 signalosome complex subunit 3 [Entophlyctis sp. JEL0112]|nr:COP9 signalosome complex subunit 3 [Entophlyctis sp. JEL0112]